MVGTALAMAASAVAGLIVGLVIAWAKTEQRQRKLDMYAEALDQQAELLDARHREAPKWAADTGDVPYYRPPTPTGELPRYRRTAPPRAFADRTLTIPKVIAGRAQVAPPALSSTDTALLPELPAVNVIARMRLENADRPAPDHGDKRTGRHRAPEPEPSEVDGYDPITDGMAEVELFEAEPVPETDEDVLARLIERAFESGEA